VTGVNNGTFDAILLDTTDFNAAEPLFTTAFYNDCKAAVAKRRPPCVRTAPPRPAWTI